MKKYIRSSETEPVLSAEDRLKDLMSVIKDNFNYAADGIDKLAADGKATLAIEKANYLNSKLDEIIADVAAEIAE